MYSYNELEGITRIYSHFQNILFPSIHLHWQKYQETLLQKLQQEGEDLLVAGDGRHDSMGHSAKYGAYTVMLCTVPTIIHFAIVQVYLLQIIPQFQWCASEPML